MLIHVDPTLNDREGSPAVGGAMDLVAGVLRGYPVRLTGDLAVQGENAITVESTTAPLNTDT